jgi:hypothetical protein
MNSGPLSQGSSSKSRHIRADSASGAIRVAIVFAKCRDGERSYADSEEGTSKGRALGAWSFSGPAAGADRTGV